MQTTFQTARPSLGAFKASSAPAARRPTVVVRAQSNVDFIKEMGKNAAVIAAGLALTMAPAAEAKIANKATKFEKNQAYQAELLNNIKSRTGKDTAVYGSLKDRPADVDPPAYVRPPLKFDGGIGSSTVETPASVPKPEPAKPATVPPPKSVSPAAPAAPAAAIDNSASIDISSYLAPVEKAPPAAAGGDNENLLAVGGLAVLGVVAAVALNNSGEGGDMQAAGAVAAATDTASSGAIDVPANVSSARAWIGAWKKKHGKA